MRIFLPKNVIFTEATRLHKYLCLPKLKSRTILLHEFSTVNEYSLLLDLYCGKNV